MNYEEITDFIESLEGKAKLEAIFKLNNGASIQKLINIVPGYENYKFIKKSISEDGFRFANESGRQLELSEDGDIISSNENLPGIFELGVKLKILKTREMLKDL